MAARQCVLYDRECIHCGECDRCDLDPDKICDNCMKCVNGDNEYRAIALDGIMLESEMAEKNANAAAGKQKREDKR